MSKTFGNRLKQLRGERPQLELATFFGVSQNGYSRWELGLTEPNIEMLSRMCDYFGVTLDELCGRDKPNRSIILQNSLKAKIGELRKSATDVAELAGALLRSIEKMEDAV